MAAYRKHWEVAMAALTFAAAGLLERGGTALGVGAGTEPTLFWLTQWMNVHATDLYLRPEDWIESANPSMLVDPGRHWTGQWEPRRLVVQHMDARELRYEDDTFDAVFSSSSLEHFGSDADIATSLDEMHRVLKPSGVCSLSTEYRLTGSGPGLPGIRMFDSEEVRQLILEGRGWKAITPFSPDMSPATRATEVPFEEAAADVRAHVQERGELVLHALRFTRYPHIVLREGELSWTSVHIGLRKEPPPRP
jgi:SAM-dependent methyltransferase